MRKPSKKPTIKRVYTHVSSEVKAGYGFPQYLNNNEENSIRVGPRVVFVNLCCTISLLLKVSQVRLFGEICFRFGEDYFDRNCLFSCHRKLLLNL